MNLKELRQQSGKSVKEVADRLNVTERAVRNYESGIRCINIEQVFPLADIYCCSVKEILESAFNSRKSLKGN